MAFRNKFEKVMDLRPDVLVLQECEHESKLSEVLEKINCNKIIWFGENPNKGIAILTFNHFEIQETGDHNDEFQYVLPVRLKGRQSAINLYCIWAMPHKTDCKKNYVGQIWGAINYYTEQLESPSILIGDFNSNAIWNNEYKIGNHAAVVNFLAEKNMHSLYHLNSKLDHGNEVQPTLYLLKNKNKPYHMDYCFLSKGLINEKTSIEIGQIDDWLKLSDHMPVVVNHIDFH